MGKEKIELKAIYMVLLAFFLACLFYPVAKLLVKSLQTEDGVGLANYAMILTQGNFLQALGNSFFISSLGALLTTTIAFVVAYTLHYTRLHGGVKKVIQVLIVLPMFLPSITYGFAIIYSFGKQGLLTRLFGGELFPIYGFWGLLLAYVIYTMPPAFLVLHNAFQYVDKNFITVSKVMGDSGFRTFINTSVRPLIGSLAAAFILSFFLSFTDFGIPTSIGGAYDVVAIQLYNQMLGAVPDFQGGAVIALFMLLPSVGSIALLRYLEKFNFRYTKVGKYEVAKNSLRDCVLFAFSALVVLGMLSVFAVMFIVPFLKSWPYQIVFTLDTVQRILGSGAIGSVYLNSLAVAAATAVIGTIFCYAAALVNARSNLGRFGKQSMNAVAMITNTVPGMVLGIAFLLTFSGTSLQNTFLLLVIVNVLHFFTTPYMMIQSALAKMNASWETTGALMGDTWIKTLYKVVIPNSLTTVYEMLGYFFVNAMVTISAVVFLAGARTMLLTTKIKELQHFEKFDEIFVLSILIFVTNVVVKLSLDYLAQPRRASCREQDKNLEQTEECTYAKYS